MSTILSRKEMKLAAKSSLRKHYWFLVFVCLIGAFFGSEFSNTLNILKLENPFNTKNQTDNITSINSLGNDDVMFDVLSSLICGNEQKGQQLSEEALRKEKQKNGNSLSTHQAGALSTIINSVSSGSFLVVIYQSLSSLFGSDNIASALLLILSLLFIIFLYFFVRQSYVVITRRLFLEAQTYETVPIQRFLFLARVKRWSSTALTLLLTFVFELLWLFTIVGFPIKYFSYYLVPYILAENPQTPPLEVIRLSKRMMKGHKWECFVMHLSFSGWELLDAISIGLLGLFFLNPYRTAFFCEYYKKLRTLAKEAGIPGSEYLNDTYLFVQAEKHLLARAYEDVMPYIDMPEPEITTPHMLQNLLTKWFGMIPLHNKEEQEYEQKKAQQLRIDKWKSAATASSYPGRLAPHPEERRRKNVEILFYARNYSIPSIVLMFFTFSFIGWLWEVFFHLVTDGTFVNRGVLHGPWLPIYGSGALLILLFLKQLREHPALEFTAAIGLCGIVEYGTAVILEYLHDGQRWWDYTGYFLNLHGRVCAEGLLVFGLGGIATVYVAAPLVDNLLRRVRQRILVPVCAILIAIFLADLLYSASVPNTGAGITDYNARTDQVYTSVLVPSGSYSNGKR